MARSLLGGRSDEADRERALRPAADWRRQRREMRRRVLVDSTTRPKQVKCFTRPKRVKCPETVNPDNPDHGIGGIWSATMDGSNEATDSNYGELSVKYEVFVLGNILSDYLRSLLANVQNAINWWRQQEFKSHKIISS